MYDRARFIGKFISEDPIRRSIELLAQASALGGNPFLFGTYLHFLQDSFSHKGFGGNGTWGHAAGTHKVDQTSFDPDKGMEMARATFAALKSFGEWRGCKCSGEPDWRKVRDFMEIGYGPSTPRGLSVETADRHLRAKIPILGVPWRSPTGR